MSASTTQPSNRGLHTPDPVCNYCCHGASCAKRTEAADSCRDLRPPQTAKIAPVPAGKGTAAA